MATNLNLNRRGAPGSSCRASMFVQQVKVRRRSHGPKRQIHQFHSPEAAAGHRDHRLWSIDGDPGGLGCPLAARSGGSRCGCCPGGVCFPISKGSVIHQVLLHDRFNLHFRHSDAGGCCLCSDHAGNCVPVCFRECPALEPEQLRVCRFSG